MPIDSAIKRRSASGVGHRIGGRGITPNAAKPLAWRQQAGWGYSGIAVGAGFVFDTVCPLSVPLYDRANIEVSMFARSELAAPLYARSELAAPLFARQDMPVPLYARTELEVPMPGCRNEV